VNEKRAPVETKVSEFIPANPSTADIATVSWLVKSEGGSAVASLASCGPEFTITVPNTWAGQNVLVMPFMRAPSAAVTLLLVCGSQKFSNRGSHRILRENKDRHVRRVREFSHDEVR